jgi:general secretion pathway protein N
MRIATIAALGIAAYVVTLVATIPASVVAARAAGALPGLELSEPSGTLWNGAALARLVTPGGQVTLDSLYWHFLPVHLASGRLAFDVSASGPGVDVHAAIGRSVGAWELRDARGQAEAPLAVAIAPWLAPWRPEGALTFAVPSGSWDEREARGDATIEWHRAAVALSEVHPLGAYRLVAHADAGSAQISVTTIEGPLTVSGKGTLTPPHRLAFSGEARGEGVAAKALEPLLDLLGPRRPDGARAVEVRLTWSQGAVEKIK